MTAPRSLVAFAAMLGLLLVSPISVGVATANTVTDDPAKIGAYGDPQDFPFAAVANQSLALMAQVNAGITPPQDAVDWLLNQQCDDGSYQASRLDLSVPCPPSDPALFSGPDTNSTAYAVMALVAVGEDAAAGEAVAWLGKVREPDGGWSFIPGAGSSDPNSTGLVISAFLATGTAVPAGADDALLGFWLGCDNTAVTNEANRGAWTTAFDVPGTPNSLATTQAIPAALGVSYPIGADANQGTFVPTLTCPPPPPASPAAPGVRSFSLQPEATIAPDDVVTTEEGSLAQQATPIEEAAPAGEPEPTEEAAPTNEPATTDHVDTTDRSAGAGDADSGEEPAASEEQPEQPTPTDEAAPSSIVVPTDETTGLPGMAMMPSTVAMALASVGLLVQDVPTNPTPGEAGAAWLAQQIASNGGFVEFFGSPDAGVTAEAVMAMVAAGCCRDEAELAAQYVAGEIDAYVAIPAGPDNDNTGALGKVALALQAADTNADVEAEALQRIEATRLVAETPPTPTPTATPTPTPTHPTDDEPPPAQSSGQLAVTGADTAPLLAGAAGLILAGVTLRVLSRRRAGT